MISSWGDTGISGPPWPRRLRERQSAGLLAADRDAEKLAAIVIAVADGLQVQWMLEPGIDMAGHIDYLVSLIDTGPRPRHPGSRFRRSSG